MKQKLNKFLKDNPGFECLMAEHFDYGTVSSVLNWKIRGVPTDKRNSVTTFMEQQEYNFEISKFDKFRSYKEKLLNAALWSGGRWEINIWCGNSESLVSLRRRRNGNHGRSKITGAKKLARRGTNA